MKQYFTALRALLDATDPTDPIEALKTFAAIDSLVREIERSLDGADYAREKLVKFRWNVLYAVAPGEETRHQPASFWLTEAQSQLERAQAEAIDFWER